MPVLVGFLAIAVLCGYLHNAERWHQVARENRALITLGVLAVLGMLADPLHGVPL